jgi:hypothetical protein
MVQVVQHLPRIMCEGLGSVLSSTMYMYMCMCMCMHMYIHVYAK